MNSEDLRLHVIRPAIEAMGLWSEPAENLVLETAQVESDLTWLKQRGGGPGSGLWQPEPFTIKDIFGRYLSRRTDLAEKLLRVAYPLGSMTWDDADTWTDEQLTQALVTNLSLGAIICRLKYLPVPASIPEDIPGRALYWLEHYNAGGAGTIEAYITAVT